MKPSDLEEVRHAMNRLRAKASEGSTMQTITVMNETAIVMDAIYRAECETARAATDTPKMDGAATIADAVIDWMIKHRLADYGEELSAADIIETLDGMVMQ